MSTPESIESPSPEQIRRMVIRFLIREIMGVVILGVILFWSAGTMNWPMGWALIALTFAWATGTLIVAIRRHPQLLAERTGPRRGAKSADTAIMGVVGLLIVGRSVVAGLDVRYGWSAEMPLALQLSMLVIAALSYALVIWATASNPFFSQIVRIQKERGHYVASGGPYRFVRHPGYVGSVLHELSAPIMLGSWWALIPGIVIFLLFIIRTSMEDRTLFEELEGYRDYSKKVRYRLFPGIW
jgi:protein-S-isoprenylcysteine O-methyltransferase Ste14